MILPDPLKVKKEKDKGEVERLERIKKLSEEETRIAKNINVLHEKERIEKQRIDVEKTKRDSITAVQKSILEIEVDDLEMRKSIALKPIDAIREENEKTRAEFTRILEENKKARLEIDEERGKMVDRVGLIVDRENELLDREKKIDSLEIAIRAGEDELKRSTEKLAGEWLKFHAEVHKTNTDIEIRAKELDRLFIEVENDRKTNDSVRESNQAEALRLKNEDIAIKDKYAALAKAKEHLGIS